MTFTKEQKEQNTLIAMVHLVQKGWTPMQSAAIVGNLTAESYMNPNTPRGDEGTAAGLAQWRFERLDKFKSIMGVNAESATLQQQLDFVDWELRNTHKKAATLLKASKTIEEATMAVDKHYERSAGLHGERRIKFAKAALENYRLVTEKANMIETASNKHNIILQLIELIISIFRKK